MPAGSSIYEFGPFRLDSVGRLLLRGDHPVSLTPKAFDLLFYLVERHGRLVTKQELISALWPDAFVEEANLTYTMSALRKASRTVRTESSSSRPFRSAGTALSRLSRTTGIGRPRPRPSRRLVFFCLSFAESRRSPWRWPSSPCCPSSSAICAKRRMRRRSRGSPSHCPTPQRPPFRCRCPRSRRTADVWHFIGARSRIYLRHIDDQAAPLPIAGTEGARALFWAPDSDQLAFNTASRVEEA